MAGIKTKKQIMKLQKLTTRADKTCVGIRVNSTSQGQT